MLQVSPSDLLYVWSMVSFLNCFKNQILTAVNHGLFVTDWQLKLFIYFLFFISQQQHLPNGHKNRTNVSLMSLYLETQKQQILNLRVSNRQTVSPSVSVRRSLSLFLSLSNVALSFLHLLPISLTPFFSPYPGASLVIKLCCDVYQRTWVKAGGRSRRSRGRDRRKEP